MLAWFRERASRLSSAVLVSLGTMGASLVVPHASDAHDADGVPAIVLHDAAAHRVTTDDSATSGEPLHCLACHWSRSFRSPTSSACHVMPAAAQTGNRIQPAVTAVALRPALAQPPLRSPPTSPLEA